MPESYIDTYYRRTIIDHADHPPLTEDRQVDVCVIGGGLAGLSTAHECVQRGLKVALLEQHRIAWGASGRNGGFVTSGYATGHEQIARRAGEAGAKALHDLSVEGVRMVRENIDRLDLPRVNPTPGVLRAIRYDDAAGLQAEVAEARRKFGTTLRYLSRDEVRQKLKSDVYFQGIYVPDAFHFHPLNYALGLGAAIVKRGGSIFEQSPATGITRDANRYTVTTPQGSITAKHVVLCGGGYTDRVAPALHRAYLPIATYMLLTEPIANIAEAIDTSAAIADDRRAGDYYRVVDGNRILWGGCITTQTRDPSNLAALMRRRIVETYPQLGDLKVAAAWSGLMSYARHLMPQIGRMPDGLWYATGFGGHGMNTTAIAGRVVAEAIAGESDRIKLFQPFGLDWNGGPFGRIAVQATYWYLQAMDAWRERRNSHA
ncbi:NAD(P)/FAD-dependent oxidoreductase [Dongia sedimenti]|uniref:FAD-binding oxidoreductase n=1 Tax=Dongia sedimenti TaxID=3064282 RepID=A0ABU0YKN4_9PROT|nr:FAD-binding oxidoreductase [Rhodospirillaceae bacterium R-7]